MTGVSTHATRPPRKATGPPLMSLILRWQESKRDRRACGGGGRPTGPPVPAERSMGAASHVPALHRSLSLVTAPGGPGRGARGAASVAAGIAARLSGAAVGAGLTPQSALRPAARLHHSTSTAVHSQHRESRHKQT